MCDPIREQLLRLHLWRWCSNLDIVLPFICLIACDFQGVVPHIHDSGVNGGGDTNINCLINISVFDTRNLLVNLECWFPYHYICWEKHWLIDWLILYFSNYWHQDINYNQIIGKIIMTIIMQNWWMNEWMNEWMNKRMNKWGFRPHFDS